MRKLTSKLRNRRRVLIRILRKRWMMVSNTRFQRTFLIMCPVDLTFAMTRSLVHLVVISVGCTRVVIQSSRVLSPSSQRHHSSGVTASMKHHLIHRQELSVPLLLGVKGRRCGSSKCKSITPPVLLCTYVDVDEPRTPPLSPLPRPPTPTCGSTHPPAFCTSVRPYSLARLLRQAGR
jgi:hypothetical protein